MALTFKGVLTKDRNKVVISRKDCGFFTLSV